MGAASRQSPVAGRQQKDNADSAARAERFTGIGTTEPLPGACYHHAVVMSDTTPEAKAIQEEALRNMTGEQRLLLAWDMSLFARELGFETHIRSGLTPKLRESCCDWRSFQHRCQPTCHDGGRRLSTNKNKGHAPACPLLTTEDWRLLLRRFD